MLVYTVQPTAADCEELRIVTKINCSPRLASRMHLVHGSHERGGSMSINSKWCSSGVKELGRSTPNGVVVVLRSSLEEHECWYGSCCGLKWQDDDGRRNGCVIM